MSQLVSVIIPVFNVEKYIVESINSVLDQTYSNIEIIIVDDCSTDNTYSTIKNNFSHQESLTLVRNKVNSKIAVTLNKALEIAKGQLIARVDGDDIMEPDRIERQVNYLKKHPNVDLVGCSFVGIDESGNTLSKVVYPSGFDLLKRLARYSSPVSHIWLAKRSLYDDLKGYRFPRVEDYDFLLRAITSGYAFDNIPNYIGMRIRLRDGNTALSSGLQQRKAFNFVRKRYFERLIYGKELLGEELFEKNIQPNWLSRFHEMSARFAHKASLNSNKLVKYFYFGLSAVLSPYQAQYLAFDLYRKWLIRSNK